MPEKQLAKRVAIVGAGLAGLSAAESLARQAKGKLEIMLFEGRRRPGGRAGSFTDPNSGETIDYCQHVLMGCCTNAIGLIERCGLMNRLRRYDALTFVHPQHPPSRFAASRLPAPLHLAGAIGALCYLTKQQKHEIRRGLFRLMRCNKEELASQTAGDWLRANGQSDETIGDFWDVILVSALGEQSDLVAMGPARKVLMDGFAAAKGASDLLVPAVPLSELFGQGVSQAVAQLGVNQRQASIRRVAFDSENAEAVIEAADGSRYQADHVIIAVPWHSTAKMLSDLAWDGLRQCQSFRPSSITGIHLWFDRPITELPHAVMVGSAAQWLFRDPLGNSSSGPSDEYYYQVVISASGESGALSKEVLLEQVLGEIRAVFPQAADASLIRSRMVSDPQAVFSITPEVEALRPPARTALPWLHLAGDWIATGWPATMEGAVISGRMAASSLMEQEFGQRVTVDPGLPRGWLADRMIK
ncbi:MAG: hydroxysqualene dehydroxylase HpnE [Rubripirellula sp.]